MRWTGIVRVEPHVLPSVRAAQKQVQLVAVIQLS
jgi:hypothetical protein